MHELQRKILLNLMIFADLVVMLIAFVFAFFISGQSVQPGSLTEYFAYRVKLLNFVFFVGWVVVWFLVLKSFGLYRSRRAGVAASEWWSVSKAVTVGTLLLSFASVILDFSAVNTIFLISFFCSALVGTIVGRFVLRSVFSESGGKRGTLRNLVIVGCGPRGVEFGKRMRNRPQYGYLLLGYVDDMPAPENPLHSGAEKLLGSVDQLPEILEEMNVDEVVITLPIASRYQEIAETISVCEEMAVDVLMPSDFFQSKLINISIEDSRAWPAMALRSQTPSFGGVVLKRLIDIFVSTVALLVLSPLLLLIAIMIKVDSRGPVFFSQDRVGLKRKTFRMHKFRTMFADSEERIKELDAENEVNGAAFKMAKDPRVTRVGKNLRKLSLDELPQFFDVLRGNMSLVGPRPLPVRDVERFDRNWQKRRFSVKPGLTCLWQINGRHEIDFEHWMELDLQYVDNWSLAMDLDILVKTVPAVLKGTGAS